MAENPGGDTRWRRRRSTISLSAAVGVGLMFALLAITARQPLPISAPATATPSPVSDPATHLAYAGAINATMENPHTWCSGPPAEPGRSQGSMVVWGLVNGDERVVEIVSFLGETQVIGVDEGPLGNAAGTPLPKVYSPAPGGALSPIGDGWYGDPSPMAYGTTPASDAGPGSGQAVVDLGGSTSGVPSGIEGLSNVSWGQGALLDGVPLVPYSGGFPTGKSRIVISGRIACTSSASGPVTTPTPAVAGPTTAAAPATEPPTPTSQNSPSPSGIGTPSALTPTETGSSPTASPPR